MPPQPAWLAPAVGMTLSAVLSSGVTAAYLRATQPDTLAFRGDLQTSAERRHLAALLVAPGEPYRAESGGAPVDAAALGGEGLTALGYARGWTRRWAAPTGERVDAFVLEFADAAGATGYARGIGNAARLLTDPEPFRVGGVPGASGLADAVADAQGRYAQLVVVHRGPRAALLYFRTRSRQPDPALVELAERQWRALPGT